MLNLLSQKSRTFPYNITSLTLMKMASAPAISTVSSCDFVCAWASRAVAGGGVGLSATSVDILRRQEIDGEVLFNLTDAKLKEDDMPRGSREKLLAAIALLRELVCPGALLYRLQPYDRCALVAKACSPSSCRKR
jgi:hypothetical protein